jgi:hypothetical protein
VVGCSPSECIVTSINFTESGHRVLVSPLDGPWGTVESCRVFNEYIGLNLMCRYTTVHSFRGSIVVYCSPLESLNNTLD